MQSPYHFERERAPAIQNLVHPIAAADEGNEVTRLKPVLIHMILDRLHPGLEDRTDNAAAPRLRPMSLVAARLIRIRIKVHFEALAL